MTLNPTLKPLGYDADARLVIFHADDVGMCHGSNSAFVDLSNAGILQTGSIMVPCPWSPQILRKCQEQPALDVGVHLTLTSEWADYRWGPISTRDVASGLVDDGGWFPHRVSDVQTRLNVQAAHAEMRAQIERVVAMGIDFTHIDTHMGAAIIPDLIQRYVDLGLEYQVPVLLPRQMDDYMRSLGLSVLGDEEHAALIRYAEERGMPLVDWFRITPGEHPAGRTADRAELYEEILRGLGPGITYFSLHPNAPGDIETIVPDRAHWRTFEYDYFCSERLKTLLVGENIIPIGYRQLRDLMRA